MKKRFFQPLMDSLSDIYNLRDDYARGRLISLGSSLITAFYNVFITGIFYTGFLSMYGISITGVGIITFIPFIANTFSLFSSSILDRFKRRKKILLAAKLFFYAMYILATTIMPLFVIDTNARLIWFAIILFVAHAVYAPFNPGITTWFYNFYPADNEKRTRYITYNQIFSSITSSVILLLSALITDAISGSPHQNTLILAFRYLAFGLVVIDVVMQAFAKEYPYPASEKTRLSDIFTLPFKRENRKFLMCMLLMFGWNYIANLHNGMWHFHLLNHMHFSYTLINLMSVMYTVILIFTAGKWRRIIRRYSWVKTFGLCNLVWVWSELAFAFMTVERTAMYVPLNFYQNFINVGFNLSYANILYLNLPREKSNTYVAFNILGCNLFAFFGLLTGTFISSITGDSTIYVLGMNAYSVQFILMLRTLLMLIMGLVLTFRWRSFTPDAEVQDIDAYEASIKRHRKSMARPVKAIKVND